MDKFFNLIGFGIMFFFICLGLSLLWDDDEDDKSNSEHTKTS